MELNQYVKGSWTIASLISAVGALILLIMEAPYIKSGILMILSVLALIYSEVYDIHNTIKKGGQVTNGRTNKRTN